MTNARPEASGGLQLPAPGPEAMAHSRRLCGLVREEIVRDGGAITFERYMELALHAPGLGYYSSGSTKLGRSGDFVTAPEISPLFSRCVARQCAQILAQTGGVILELGAGTGAMAVDLLTELDSLGGRPERYLILETSADLRERQEQQLRQRAAWLLDCVCWLDALPVAPLRGVILANEVIDALPVHRIELRGDEVMELCVQTQGDGFEWLPVAAAGTLSAQVGALLRTLPEFLPAGYITELNTRLGPWVAAMAGILKQGALLCLDYGYPRHEYYHPQRTSGTLRCYYRHRVHDDPFFCPGLQDITACVDFSALAEAGIAVDLELYGFTNQAQFLLGCGLDTLLAAHAGTGDRARLETARQVRLLTLPGEMGERIKALCLGRGLAGPLAGFSPVDQRHRL